MAIAIHTKLLSFDSYLVWIDEKNERPIVRITGSHKHSCIFGAVSMEGKKQQLFRQYNIFNGITFLDYLKIIHSEFPKYYIFMEKASPHYECEKVRAYVDNHKDTLILIYLSTASAEFMVMVAIWNIAKRGLLVLKYYSSFVDLKNKILGYFRTKRFNLDMINYLLRD